MHYKCWNYIKWELSYNDSVFWFINWFWQSWWSLFCMGAFSNLPSEVIYDTITNLWPQKLYGAVQVIMPLHKFWLSGTVWLAWRQTSQTENIFLMGAGRFGPPNHVHKCLTTCYFHRSYIFLSSFLERPLVITDSEVYLLFPYLGKLSMFCQNIYQ